MFQTPTSTTRQKELKLINCIVSTHDCLCECNNPAYHSLYILTKQLKPELQKKEIEQLQKCLGDADTTTKEEDTGYDIGDLEKLFGEGDDEEDPGTR